MDEDQRFEAMVDACLQAHEAVAAVGTPAMLALSRALLFQVGQDVIQREERRKQILPRADAEEQGAAP